MGLHPIDMARIALVGALAYQVVERSILYAQRREPHLIWTVVWCLDGAAMLLARFVLRNTESDEAAVWATRLAGAALLALLPIALGAMHSYIDRKPTAAYRLFFFGSVVPPILCLTSDAIVTDRLVPAIDMFGVEFWVADKGPWIGVMYVFAPLVVAYAIYLIRLTRHRSDTSARRVLAIVVGVVAVNALVNAIMVRTGYRTPQIDDFGVPAIAWAFTYAYARRNEAMTNALAELGESRGRFIAASLEAQEVERERISRELHDSIGQSVSSLLVQMQAIEHVDDSEVRERTRALKLLARDTLDEVRRTARGLHPSALVDLGLEQALISYAREFQDAHHIEVDLHLRGLDRRLPRDVELALYRITQESLTNVARHAEAASVSVVVEADERRVRLIVDDDGRGMEAAGDPGLGLTSIRERAVLLGGTIEVESAPGQGTALYVTVPRASGEASG